MLRFAFASVAVVAVGSLALTGCPKDNYDCPAGQYYDANIGACTGGGYGQQCPPGTVMGPQGCMSQQQCPPGQVFNGQMCVAGGGAPQCPAGQSWNGQQCVAQGGGLGGMFGGSQCTPAQPLDPASAAAVTQGLPFLGQQHAPGGKPVGPALSGNFQAGQCLEMQVTLNPGKCYTAVGVGAQGQEVDVHLAPGVPSPVPLPPFAQDNTSGPMAVMGGGNNCFKNPSPIPGPAKLVLRVSSGAGMAAAQLYER